MQSIYSYRSYRKLLNDWVATQPHGSKSALAEGMGCQNSHLTRVLREEVHLTMDQAFGASEHLKLAEGEARYFLKLVEYERAATQAYRTRIRQQLDAIKSEQENLAKRFQERAIGDYEREMTYYSSWVWSAIHVATYIPGLTAPREIAQRLNLDEALVRNHLVMLEKFGLLLRRGDHWFPTDKFMHLSKDSPMNAIQHRNWRERAAERSRDTGGNGLHYTMVQTVSREDFGKIKTIMLDTIDRYRKVANPSKEEELVCFSMDFFAV